MSKFHLVLLAHAHQPLGNFDDVCERAYEQSYRPFVELLLRHPLIRVGLHYSGLLLEWIEARHPDYFDLLRELGARGQVELVGGGFYEPILVAIPPEDRIEQLDRLAGYLERHFGCRPSGAWLAERVWEPALPATFAQAGVDYTLVDDTHFLASGFESDELCGYYLVEELGGTVKVIPGLKTLRYLIPYRSVEENIDFLRAAAARHPEGMAASGDDLEKFGVWPETYEHCYRNGWLERFFSELEAAADWLELTTPGAYLAAHPPLGRAALPAAAYAEMMEWALPAPARQRLEGLEREFAGRPDVLAFLRGGFWRNFLIQYSEANLLHKKMLYISRRAGSESALGARPGELREQARTHLLRAQCNDAYWHGIFGGLYAPHLRTALWQELLRAEKRLVLAEHGRRKFAEVERLDFDCDGQEEIYLRSCRYTALVKPSDGATIAVLDFPLREVTLINSLTRRPEACHTHLRNLPDQAGGVASIHEMARAKEPGLEKLLRYDRWQRHAFRLLLFDRAKRYEDYAAVGLEEDERFAAGSFRVESASPEVILFSAEGRWAGGAELACRKTLAFRPVGDANGFEVECSLELRTSDAGTLELAGGLELVLNFLAPAEPDRYFQFSRKRYPLGWGGVVPSASLRIADKWQNVAARLEAPGARELWIAPIETVSESEGGFERVYQGSGILAVWPIRLEPGRAWTARLALRISSLA